MGETAAVMIFKGNFGGLEKVEALSSSKGD